jgi:hypothetical protein
MVTKEKMVMQFKITLNDSTPKVWRRIVVPKGYSFFDLHCAIQNSVGWSDSHLHGFYIAQKGTARQLAIQFPDPEGYEAEFASETLDERKEKIADYFGVKIKQCQYTYDFGDSWDHTVVFEKEFVGESAKKYPICLAGENACPVEDCGGVGGYDQLLETLQNPKSKDYQDMCEWLGIEDGDEIDPTEFDKSEVIFENPAKRLKEWEDGFRI